jgi:hypothetical protein
MIIFVATRLINVIDCELETSAIPSEQDTICTEWERYDAYLRQEFPILLRQELEQRLFNHRSDLEEGILQDDLPTVFRELQIRHFREYVQRRRTSAGWQTSEVRPQSEHNVPAQLAGPAGSSDVEVIVEPMNLTMPPHIDLMEVIDPSSFFDDFNGILWNAPTWPTYGDSGFVSSSSQIEGVKDGATNPSASEQAPFVASGQHSWPPASESS